MEEKEVKRPQWNSQLGFILAAVGSAVGLGNIWRFPYIMGQNGGAVFLMVYLALILTICFIPLICEMFLGKYTKKESVTAMGSINPKLKIFGWSNTVTAIIISSFYFVVGGWIIYYIFQGFINNNVQDYVQFFTNISSSTFTPIALSILFLLCCQFFIIKGVNKGIELGNKIMMPIFAAILIALVIFSLNLPDAQLGLNFMFKPDFSKFTGSMVLTALGQALFTLSIGMGAILTYGSYMKEEDNIVKSTYTIILSDTMFAILAGIMIFPAVFSFGLEPSSGAGLVFITLPKIFSQIPFGNIVSVAFFILLFFAALTSGISILEVPTASFMENFKITRRKAVGIITLIVGFFSVLASLSFGLLSNFKIFGKTIFDLMDIISSNYLLPFNTLILCLVVGWFMGDKVYEIFKNKIVKIIFKIGLKFVVPIALILIILNLKFW